MKPMDDDERTDLHEEAVLGACLYSSQGIEQVRSILDPCDFWSLGNQIIYRAILDLNDNGLPADPITVSDKLQEDGSLDLFGRNHIAELAALTTSAANAAHHAELIKQAAKRRRNAEDVALLSSQELLERRLGYAEVDLASARQEVADADDRAAHYYQLLVAAEEKVGELSARVGELEEQALLWQRRIEELESALGETR